MDCLRLKCCASRNNLIGRSKIIILNQVCSILEPQNKEVPSHSIPLQLALSIYDIDKKDKKQKKRIMPTLGRDKQAIKQTTSLYVDDEKL